MLAEGKSVRGVLRPLEAIPTRQAQQTYEILQSCNKHAEDDNKGDRYYTNRSRSVVSVLILGNKSVL
jgi:hypothetical protein